MANKSNRPSAKSLAGTPSPIDTTSPAITYSVHPGIAMVEKWVVELKSKTGRTLEEWKRFIVQKGPATLVDRRKWLKEEHGLGTNTAWWLAERADGQPTFDESPTAYLQIAPVYVTEMFAKKQELLPIYHALIALAQEVADDIKFCPCKTIVPFYRHHVIAEVKPATKTRLDFGLALGDLPGDGRLKETGGFQKKDRITHKLELADRKEVDKTVAKWLKKAYNRDV